MTAFLKIFDVIPGWVYGIIIALLLLFAGQRHLAMNAAKLETAQAKEQLAAVKAEHQTLVAEAAKRNQQAADAARDKEFQLSNKITLLEKKRNEDVAATARNYERVIAGLRNRPSRETAGTDSPGSRKDCSASGTTKGATGAELYREDGAFLIGEAARADNLRSALGTCYAAWDQAKAILERVGAVEQPPPDSSEKPRSHSPSTETSVANERTVPDASSSSGGAS